jgi:hypothetical protein
MPRSRAKLRTPQFEYGPLARGCYIALISLLPVSAIGWPGLLPWHVGLVLFLGIGLRPLLEWSGLYAVYAHLAAALEEWWNRDLTEQRRREVERKARRARYKRFGPEDPRLPKNW